MTDVDVLIIGGGAMGLSTAWQLARRGRSVRLLEQFQPGHHQGGQPSPHGSHHPVHDSSEFLTIRADTTLPRELVPIVSADRTLRIIGGAHKLEVSVS